MAIARNSTTQEVALCSAQRLEAAKGASRTQKLRVAAVVMQNFTTEFHDACEQSSESQMSVLAPNWQQQASKGHRNACRSRYTAWGNTYKSICVGLGLLTKCETFFAMCVTD